MPNNWRKFQNVIGFGQNTALCLSSCKGTENGLLFCMTYSTIFAGLALPPKFQSILSLSLLSGLWWERCKDGAFLSVNGITSRRKENNRLEEGYFSSSSSLVCFVVYLQKQLWWPIGAGGRGRPGTRTRTGGKTRATSTNSHFRNSSFQIWMPVLVSGPSCGQELFYNISPSVCYDVACVPALIISFFLLLIRFHPKSHHQSKTSINLYQIVLFLFYFSIQLQRKVRIYFLSSLVVVVVMVSTNKIPP